MSKRIGEHFGAATLFDDVIEFLDDLRILKIPLVIVTDLTAQVQFRKIVYFGLDYYFDYVVTSEEAGADKPSERPFKLAIEKINCSPNEIWMIGDNSLNDIKGARQHVNALTFQKIHKGVDIGKCDQKPDVAFSNYSELRKLLKKMESQRNGD